MSNATKTNGKAPSQDVVAVIVRAYPSNRKL